MFDRDADYESCARLGAGRIGVMSRGSLVSALVAFAFIGGCKGTKATQGDNGLPSSSQAAESGNSSVPGTSDAENALSQISKGVPDSVRYGGGTVPTSCVPGKIGQQEVQACHVCTVFAQIRLDGIALSRTEYAVPFKRAISYEQPDVAPIDNGAGVWVPVLPTGPMGTTQLPNSTVLSSRMLQQSDLTPFGIQGHMTIFNQMDYVFVENGQSMDSNPNNNGPLLHRLAVPAAAVRMQRLVGTCPGNTLPPEVDVSSTLEPTAERAAEPQSSGSSNEAKGGATALSNADMEGQALRLTRSYFASWSGSGTNAIAFLEVHVPASLIFYGKATSELVCSRVRVVGNMPA